MTAILARVFLAWNLLFAQLGGPMFPGPGTPASNGGGSSPTISSIHTASSGSFGSPYSLAITAAVPVGSIVSVWIGEENSSDTDPGFTIKDSKGNCSNAYTEEKFQAGLNSADSSLYDCVITTALTTSDHITATATTDAAFSFFVTATANVSAIDSTALKSASYTAVTTITTATYTPSYSASVVCSIFFNNFAWSAYGNVIGSAATIQQEVGPSGRVGVLECRALSSNTAGTAAYTATGSSDGAYVFAGYH